MGGETPHVTHGEHAGNYVPCHIEALGETPGTYDIRVPGVDAAFRSVPPEYLRKGAEGGETDSD